MPAGMGARAAESRGSWRSQANAAMSAEFIDLDNAKMQSDRSDLIYDLAPDWAEANPEQFNALLTDTSIDDQSLALGVAQLAGMDDALTIIETVDRTEGDDQLRVWDSLSEQHQTLLRYLGYTRPVPPPERGGIGLGPIGWGLNQLQAIPGMPGDRDEDNPRLGGDSFNPVIQGADFVLNGMSEAAKTGLGGVLSGMDWVGDRADHLARVAQAAGDVEGETFGFLPSGAFLNQAPAILESITTGKIGEIWSDQWKRDDAFLPSAKDEATQILGGDPLAGALARKIASGASMAETVEEFWGVQPGSTEFLDKSRELLETMAEPDWDRAIQVLARGRTGAGQQATRDLGLDPRAGVGLFVAGSTQLAFDIMLDPTLVAGKGYQAAKAATSIRRSSMLTDLEEAKRMAMLAASRDGKLPARWANELPDRADVEWAREATVERLAGNNPAAKILLSEDRSLARGRRTNAAFERVVRAFDPEDSYTHWDLRNDLPQLHGALPDMIRWAQQREAQVSAATARLDNRYHERLAKIDRNDDEKLAELFEWHGDELAKLGNAGIKDVSDVWDFFTTSAVSHQHIMSKATGIDQVMNLPSISPAKELYLKGKGFWTNNVLDASGHLTDDARRHLIEMSDEFQETKDVDVLLGHWPTVEEGQRLLAGGHGRIVRSVSRFAAGFTSHVPRSQGVMRHSAVGGRAEVEMTEEFGRLLDFGNLVDMPKEVKAKYFDAFLHGDAAERGMAIRTYVGELVGRSGMTADPRVKDLLDRYVRSVDQAYSSDIFRDGVQAGSLRFRGAIYGTQDESVMAIPDFGELAKAISHQRLNQMVLGRPLLGAYHHFDWMIQKAWKPLQLMRIGFITRTTMEEVAAFTLRMNPSAYVRAKFGADWALGVHRNPVTGEVEGLDTLNHTGRRLLTLTNTTAKWAGVDRARVNAKAIDLFKDTSPAEFARLEKAGRITDETLAPWVNELRSRTTGLSGAIWDQNERAAEYVAEVLSPAMHRMLHGRVNLPSRRDIAARISGVDVAVEGGTRTTAPQLAFHPRRGPEFTAKQEGWTRLVQAYSLALTDPWVRSAYASPILGTYSQYGQQAQIGPRTSRMDGVAAGIRVPMRVKRGAKWSPLSSHDPRAQAQYFANVSQAASDPTVRANLPILASFVGEPDLADLGRAITPTANVSAMTQPMRAEIDQLMDQAEQLMVAGDITAADAVMADAIDRQREMDDLLSRFDGTPDAILAQAALARQDLARNLSNARLRRGLNDWLDLDDKEGLYTAIQSLPDGPARQVLESIAVTHDFVGPGTRELFRPDADLLARELTTSTQQVQSELVDSIFDSMMLPGNQPTLQSLYRSLYLNGTKVAHPPKAGHVRLYGVQVTEDQVPALARIALEPQEMMEGFVAALRRRGIDQAEAEDAAEVAYRALTSTQKRNLDVAFANPEVADEFRYALDAQLARHTGNGVRVTPTTTMADVPEQAMTWGFGRYDRETGDLYEIRADEWKQTRVFDTRAASLFDEYAEALPADQRAQLVQTRAADGTLRWRDEFGEPRPGEELTGERAWGAGLSEYAAARQLAQDRADDVIDLLTTFRNDGRPNRSIRELVNPAKTGSLSTGYDKMKVPQADIPKSVLANTAVLEPDRLSFGKIAGAWFADVVSPVLDSVIRTPHFVHQFARTLEPADQIYRQLLRGKLNDEVVGVVGDEGAGILAANAHQWWDAFGDLDPADWREALADDPAARFLYAVKTQDAARAYEALDQLPEAVQSVKPLLDDPAAWRDRTLERWLNRTAVAQKEAVTSAVHHAIDLTVPFIDDHRVRSQFSEHVSGLMPFWHAEEQFLKRQVRMVAQSPETIRRAQHWMDGMRHAGLIREDAEGEEIFVYPGTQQLSAGVLMALGQFTGMPHLEVLAQPMSADVDYMLPGFSGEQMTGSFGTGPMVGLTLSTLVDQFPELAKLEQVAVEERGVDREWFQYFLPSTIDTALGAAMPAVFRKERMASATARAIQGLHAAGLAPDETATPMEIEKFHDQVKGHARYLAIIDATLTLGSPLPSGSRINIGNIEYSDAWNEIMDLGLPFHEAAQEFERRYPNADAYTVFATESASGAPMARTAEAYQWIMSHENLLAEFDIAGSWFMPMPEAGDEFDRRAQNEIMRRGLRQQRTPEEYLEQLYITDASPAYWSIVERFDREIYAAELAGDSQRRAQLNDEKRRQTQAFLRQHPVFAASLEEGEGRQRRAKIKEQVEAMLALPPENRPQGEQADDLYGLMESWMNFSHNMGALQHNRGKAATAKRQELRQGFLLFAEDYIAEHPGARAFYDSVIRWDQELGGFRMRMAAGLEDR